MSPVGVIHLFRQYFFELTSFLGTPVGHVWISPGTTVELTTHKQMRNQSALTLTVEAVISTVRHNFSAVGPYTSGQTGRIVASKEVCIQDLRAGEEWTEGTCGPLLKSGNLVLRAKRW
ncbi:hypothetical protein [Saccharothrix stipae]